MRRAFITGVSGFVGPYLASHLAANGFEVFGIDRKGSRVAGCSVKKCDITDYDSLFAIVARLKPDVVFHLAGQSSVARSWDEPELTMKVNVGGTKNLFEAISAAKLSPRVLLVSSAEIYGIPKKLPITEEHPLSPISPYGESKVEQEKLASEFVAKRKLNIVTARSFNHTGPGQPPDFVCSNFARQIADIEKGRQQPVIKVADRNVKRDFSDVRDVVAAYLLLVEKGVNGGVYNVCSGQAFTIGEILAKLLKLSAAKVRVEPDPFKMKNSVVPILHGDNSKLVKATGWKPAIGIDKTLSDILEYWRKR